MRQVYKFKGDGFDIAWIGDKAPIPDGFHLDANKAREVLDPIKKGNSHAVRNEEKAQGSEAEVTAPEFVITDKDEPAPVAPQDKPKRPYNKRK